MLGFKGGKIASKNLFISTSLSGFEYEKYNIVKAECANKEHVAPQFNCNCGVHGTISLKISLEYGFPALFDFSGKIIITELGFRAEFATFIDYFRFNFNTFYSILDGIYKEREQLKSILTQKEIQQLEENFPTAKIREENINIFCETFKVPRMFINAYEENGFPGIIDLIINKCYPIWDGIYLFEDGSKNYILGQEFFHVLDRDIRILEIQPIGEFVKLKFTDGFEDLKIPIDFQSIIQEFENSPFKQ